MEPNEDGTVGGSFRSLFLLVRHLDRARYEPVVLYYQSNPYVARMRELGIEVHVWESLRGDERAAGSALPARAWALGSAIGRRARFLHRARIDLVHLNAGPALNFQDWLPAARLMRRRCISHARSVLPMPTRRASRWLTKRFDWVLCNSNHVADAIAAQGVPRGRLRRIYNGIEIDELRASVRRSAREVRRELGLEDGQILAVMVGHLRPWKGQHVVLEAVGQLSGSVRRRLRVALVGATPLHEQEYTASLKRRIQALGIESCVTILGNRDDVPDLLNAADLALHASLDPEPFGLVVLEALAFEKPVVAAARGGPLEILGGGCGILFDPDDPAALAHILDRMVLDPAARKAAAEGALPRARCFEIGRVAREVEAVYLELVG